MNNANYPLIVRYIMEQLNISSNMEVDQALKAANSYSFPTFLG